MANPSVTYNFSNSTTADADQVDQNFTDLINAMTDGTKDFSISALTVSGAAVFTGAVTLGNGTPDDITVTGSLASSIPIKTTNSFDIGSSTLGLAGVYLGSSGGAFTTRVVGAAVASSYTLTLPLTGGTAGYGVRTNGSGSLAFVAPSPSAAMNYALAASVGSSALTVSLMAASGSAATAANPIDIVFRNSTAATGTPVVRQVTGSTTVVAPSTATLGHISGVDQEIHVYAIDNAGTVELAISGGATFDEGKRHTTTAIGTGSDSNHLLYSTSARTDVAIRYLGRMISNQVAAGDWLLVPTEISLKPSRSQFWVSSYLAGGSRVTGADPDALGEYRTYLRQASAVTYTETNATPGTAPSAANGMLIYGNSSGWASQDSNSEPSRYDIFVGKNKRVTWYFYTSTGRTGRASVDVFFLNTSGGGCFRMYDPTTGIASIMVAAKSSATANNLACVNETQVLTTDMYFDILVEDL